MRVRVAGGTGTAVALLVVAACGGGPAAPGGTPSSPVAATSAAGTPTTSSSPGSAGPATPEAAPTPPVGTRPVVSCLNGAYRLVRVTDVAPDAAYRSATGGDVELRFSGAEFPDGNYVGTAYALVAAGKRAMTLTPPAGPTRSLVVKAKANGSYTLADSEATFARGPGTGSGRLTGGGGNRTLDLAQVQAIVTPVGTLTVSCTKTTLWLTGRTVQLELHAS